MSAKEQLGCRPVKGRHYSRREAALLELLLELGHAGLGPAGEEDRGRERALLGEGLSKGWDGSDGTEHGLEV